MSYPARKVGTFMVDVYHRSSKESLNGHSGTGDEWKLRTHVTVSHDDDSYAVDFVDTWLKLLNSEETRMEQEVTGYCTIVKWGNTMQLTETFRVVIEIQLDAQAT